MSDKLTIEDIESYISIFENSTNPVLSVYKQLADTMRENQFLRASIRSALDDLQKAYPLSAEAVLDNAVQSYKQSEVCEECDGRGQVETDCATCISCRGSGKPTKTT